MRATGDAPINGNHSLPIEGSPETASLFFWGSSGPSVGQTSGPMPPGFDPREYPRNRPKPLSRSDMRSLSRRDEEGQILAALDIRFALPKIQDAQVASTPIPSLSVLSVKSVVFLLRTLCRLQRNHGFRGLHGWEGASSWSRTSFGATRMVNTPCTAIPSLSAELKRATAGGNMGKKG